MGRLAENVAVFGEHDAATLAQLRDVASRSEAAALMADGHVGYVMPIGGIAAYREQVSVVGVGFDIACLPAGTPVTTGEGFTLPIEQITAAEPVTCWDGRHVRLLQAHVGAVPQGNKPLVQVTLANGRVLRATTDHQVLTKSGWTPAGELTAAEAVACSPFVGLPHAPFAEEIAITLRDTRCEAELGSKGLYPLRGDVPRFLALVRLLGYVSGDGHLTKNGNRVSIYVYDEADAASIAADLRGIGYPPRLHRRCRPRTQREEFHLCVDSVALHSLFAGLGSPVGKKEWPESPMSWLFEAPAWVRSVFLSAFCSAEMMTPRVTANGLVPNLQLKQSGANRNAINHVARLLESLEFEVSVGLSAMPIRGRPSYVLQILGGQTAQLRFLESVGFCYSAEKRVRAAVAASVAWAGEQYARNRDAAKEKARRLRSLGVHWRKAVANVAEEFGVSRGFVYHSFYDVRGKSRRLPGAAVTPQVSGELCWVPVDGVRADGCEPVYDIVSGDAAHCYFASGIVVHNCGNAAIRTDLTLADLAATERVLSPHGASLRGGPELSPHEASLRGGPELGLRLNGLADEIQATVSFGIGRKNLSDDAPVDHPLFDDPAWDAVPAAQRQALRDKARGQLGTVGSGNHYVDVFADEEGRIWVGVHFGSRGFGHTVASGFLALGQNRRWGERVPEREVLLPLAQPLGHDYWELMNLAGRYAYAGREWVARKVVAILGGRELELVHNHHNFAWREQHDGREYIVVRKGATPAFPGQKGFVGASMGDDAVIVQGAVAGDPESATARLQREALFSTVHGAGRVMSRTAAAGKRNRKTGEVISPGRVSPEMMDAWVRKKGVILRGGGLDESPHVYRRLPDVLAAQGGTVEVLHTLRPLIVVMAGANEFDPYKD